MKKTLSIFLIITIGLLFFFMSHHFDGGQDAVSGHQLIEENLKMRPPMIAVTEKLLPLRNSERRKHPITHVVLHFTSNVKEKPEAPFLVDDIFQVFIDYEVSSHFLIDREGLIYRLVEEDRIAYHAGPGNLIRFPQYEDNLNAYSIGIELLAIGAKTEMEEFIDEATYNSLDPAFLGFTDEQYDALSELLEYLHVRYPEIERNRNHVIGHDEYAPGRKTDPGSLFDWERLNY